MFSKRQAQGQYWSIWAFKDLVPKTIRGAGVKGGGWGVGGLVDR